MKHQLNHSPATMKQFIAGVNGPSFATDFEEAVASGFLASDGQNQVPVFTASEQIMIAPVSQF